MAITLAGRRRLEAFRKAEEIGQLELPWGGKSPRDLTRSAIAFRFRLEAATLDEEDAKIDEQYRRFSHGT